MPFFTKTWIERQLNFFYQGKGNQSDTKLGKRFCLDVMSSPCLEYTRNLGPKTCWKKGEKSLEKAQNIAGNKGENRHTQMSLKYNTGSCTVSIVTSAVNLCRFRQKTWNCKQRNISKNSHPQLPPPLPPLLLGLHLGRLPRWTAFPLSLRASFHGMCEADSSFSPICQKVWSIKRGLSSRILSFWVTVSWHA